MSDKLLSYAVSANQDPIQASPQQGDPSLLTLIIVVSNNTGQSVDCKSISFGFLQGTNARDLFSDSTGIGTSVPAGWSISQDSSLFTATPDSTGDGQVGPSGLTFVISNIQVNEQPGTTEMTVTETTANNIGILSSPLAKFPAQFNVGQLLATPRAVEQGGSTTLSWSGSGGATYTLQYVDENSNTVTITETKDGQPLPSTGTCTIDSLRASTTFYLLVEVTVPGQDTALSFQREASVSVAIPPVKINSFNVSATSVSMPGDEVTFTWDVTAATQVQLNTMNVEGNSITVQVDETTTYTLQALGGRGPVTSSITVTVDSVTINSFTANPTTIYGENNEVPVTLAWDVQSASQLTLNGAVVTGTSAVMPANGQTTFTLAAIGYPVNVYESCTVYIEDVNLKVWLDSNHIYCSFGANVGSYSAILLITYAMSGVKQPMITTGSFQSTVTTPGVIQFGINISTLPGFLVVKSVEVAITGFPSGVVEGSYPS